MFLELDPELQALVKRGRAGGSTVGDEVEVVEEVGTVKIELVVKRDPDARPYSPETKFLLNMSTVSLERFLPVSFPHHARHG